MAPVAQYLSDFCGVLEPIQTEHSIEGQINELKTILVNNANPPVYLIGFSWGAWLCYIFSAIFPTLVKKLILVSSGPFLQKYTATIQATRLNRLNKKERTEAQIFMEQLKDPQIEDKNTILAKFGSLFSKADTYDPIKIDHNHVECRADIFQSVWKEATTLRQSGKLLNYGKLIKCPVIAIHGDYDPHPYEGVQDPLSFTLKKFQFYLLKNCGHMPWIEKNAREEFYEILKDILM